MVTQSTADQATAVSDVRGADHLLLQASRHGRVWTLLLAVTAVLGTVAEIALPALLGRTVDSLVFAQSSLVWVIGCVAVVVLLVLCDTLGGLAAGRGSAAGTAWLRHTMIQHMLALGDRATQRFSRGDLVSRLVSSAAEAGNAAAVVVWATLSFVPSIGSLVALWLIYPWLAVAFVTGLPILVVLLRSFARDTTDLITRYQRSQGRIAAALMDALGGIRTIRAAATLDREQGRVLRELPALSELGHGTWRAQTRISAQGALIVPLLEVAVLSVAGFALSAGHISHGEMIAAWRYVALGTGFGMPAMLLARLARARGGGRRVHEVLTEPAMRYGTASLPAGPGELEFRNISLVVAQEQVFDGLNLVVPAGSSLAVVGRSGTGKSLLAAIAGRLLDPDVGDVVLDGVPLSTLNRKEIRDAIGYAFERPALVGETLADVIGLGLHQPSADLIEQAARAAQADAFIERLPQGYRTRLQKAPLSGGEAQRLGLARAFAHNGRVLILDDATSSLDTATELQISSILTGQLSDRTRIIVAHRASTAALANLVVWLDEGRIRAIGPHRDLWRNPAYRANFTPGVPPAGSASPVDRIAAEETS
ncbi:ABC transporter ATP-binding protein [Streptomyces inusitatus]|uniref:ABC transporter ATP-binding protein n=1 Tax=Streptomyces inusitatus TaxID=68221 RepID=A0A918Q329_9ACTN|nr:ABC transporter ATP-binding protein [Streptomyces inusitatus]GGZ32176.1 ABC transporter ATP-binding protein [Streptomyces inusitatus]